MAPLVLLVGKNNTGKSYIASLLWSLLNFEDVFLSSRDSVDQLPEWFRAIIDDNYDADNDRVEVSPEMFAAWVSRVLDDRLSTTLSRVLSLHSAKIGTLTLSLPRPSMRCAIVREPLDEGEPYLGRWSGRSDNDLATIDFSVKQDVSPLTKRAIFSSVGSVFLAGMAKPGSSERAMYVPAARTGLMLALAALTASALDHFGLAEPEIPTQFSLPVIRFLQALAGGKRRRGSTGYEGVATFLEENILHGRIVQNDEDAGTSFSYQVDGELEIPLHAASSMVTELAPLLLLLRNHSFDRGLIFEEPEAHLHLAAQRVMARAIVRLVNIGVPVIVTTHSDTFLQELNILMQLHRHSDRDSLVRKLGYEDQDLLDPSSVRGYEFVPHGNRSNVIPAEIGEYGIVVPTLNDTLNAIADELQTVLD